MRLLILNAGRGFAAVAVMVSHFRGVFDFGPMFYQNAPYLGAFGVAVFFFISGFVIPLSLEKALPGPFLVRRVFRLYPIVVAVCCAWLLRDYLAGAERGITLKAFLLNISLFGEMFQPQSANVESIFWSLNVEVKFYLLMAFVFFVVRRFSLPLYAIIIGLSVACLAASLSFDYSVRNSSPFLHDLAVTITFLPLMLAGALIFQKWADKISTVQFVAGLIILALASYLSPFRSPVHLLAGVAFVGLIVIGDRWNAVRLRPVQWLGDISYPLYAIHPLCLTVAYNLSGPTWFKLFFAVVATLAAADILHRLIERPFMNWSKRSIHSGDRMISGSAPAAAISARASVSSAGTPPEESIV